MFNIFVFVSIAIIIFFFRTIKNGCAFFLVYSLSNDGKYLEMKKSDFSHNHPVNYVLFKMHYVERRLPESIAKKAEDLMHMQVNK